MLSFVLCKCYLSVYYANFEEVTFSLNLWEDFTSWWCDLLRFTVQGLKTSSACNWLFSTIFRSNEDIVSS